MKVDTLKSALILNRVEFNLSSIEKIDTKSMRSMIEGFPILLRKASLDDKVKARAIELHKTGIKGICMVGMGGSSIAGEMCKWLLNDQAKIPLISVRDYDLPAFVNEKWVTIAVSYSGNTEETLTAFDEASKKGCEIITITTGGKLGELSEPTSCNRLYPDFQPRAALPLILSAEYLIVNTLLGLHHENLVELSKKIEAHHANWGSVVPFPRDIAKSIIDHIPVFIAWGHLKPVAYRAKCQVNENSKAIAIQLEIPESNHNEIEATLVCAKHSVLPIFLRSKWESNKITKRVEATSEIYSLNGCNAEHIHFQCESKLEEMLALTHYFDMVSVELAELLNVDPVSVDRITHLKKKIT